MTDRSPDWGELRDEWLRGGSAQGTVAAPLRLAAKARREQFFLWLIESAIGGAALLAVVFALIHSHNAYEVALGLIVGLGIGTVWIERTLLRRRQHAAETTMSDDYLTGMRQVRAREVRLAQFVWIVVSLELIFLIPWWVVGSRVHSRRPTDFGSLLTMWLPIVVFVALSVWSFRLRRRAQLEMSAIDAMRAEYGAGQ
jgi:NADH:ubiquinone oxidoreductase subunit 3 (subunit A)